MDDPSEIRNAAQTDWTERLDARVAQRLAMANTRDPLGKVPAITPAPGEDARIDPSDPRRPSPNPQSPGPSSNRTPTILNQ